MASSSTEICNLALIRLGADTVADIDEATLNAGYCKFVYAHCVDWLLRKHDWAFALKRETLAESAETNLTPYVYMYQLPTGVARPVRVLDADYVESIEPWEIKGSQVYSDEATATLEFIDENVNVARYDEAFVRVLSLMIAWQISMKITSSNDIRKEVHAEFRGELREATGLDAQLGKSRDAEEPLWTTVR